MFGSVAIASSRLETVEEVVDRLKAAMDHIDRKRLVIAPDCGLGLLSANLAEAQIAGNVSSSGIGLDWIFACKPCGFTLSTQLD